MRTRLILSVLLASPALAQTIYSWEEPDGTHYTDDSSQAPTSATKTGYVREPSGLSPTSDAGVPVALAKRVVADPAPLELDEGLWRTRFIELYRRRAYLKESIVALEGALPPPTLCVMPVVQAQPGPSPTLVFAPMCQANIERDRMLAQIASEKVQLNDLEREIDQTERDASRLSVPREWRRGY